MGYRVPATEATPPMLVKRWYARPLCWIIGHRWHVLAINTGKNAGLAHLHPDAGFGADKFCRRCGAESYRCEDATFIGFQRVGNQWDTDIVRTIKP